MKHSIILFLFAGLLFIPITFGATYYAAHNEMTTEQSSSTVDLHGRFIKGGLRSGTDPIIVDQQDNSLVILFQNDVGVLHVTITGTQGLVYNTLVDTSIPSTLIIPLVNFPSGNYTIVFNNEYGTMQGNITL